MDDFSPRRGWIAKFAAAFRGVRLGVRGSSSCAVHVSFAVAVVACGFAFRVSLGEWWVLILCIAGVLSAELFNSALETLAKAIDRRENPQIGAALDIASGAVLVTACGAAATGGLLFLNRLGLLWEWW